MILDRFDEIIKLTEIDEVNEYLEETESHEWKLHVWELIACVPETVEPGVIKTVYILGRKWINM